MCCRLFAASFKLFMLYEFFVPCHWSSFTLSSILRTLRQFFMYLLSMCNFLISVIPTYVEAWRSNPLPLVLGCMYHIHIYPEQKILKIGGHNCKLQGQSWQTVIFELALTDTNMQVRFYFKRIVKFWDVENFATATCFHDMHSLTLSDHFS